MITYNPKIVKLGKDKLGRTRFAILVNRETVRRFNIDENKSYQAKVTFEGIECLGDRKPWPRYHERKLQEPKEEISDDFIPEQEESDEQDTEPTQIDDMPIIQEEVSITDIFDQNKQDPPDLIEELKKEGFRETEVPEEELERLQEQDHAERVSPPAEVSPEEKQFLDTYRRSNSLMKEQFKKNAIEQFGEDRVNELVEAENETYQKEDR